MKKSTFNLVPLVVVGFILLAVSLITQHPTITLAQTTPSTSSGSVASDFMQTGSTKEIFTQDETQVLEGKVVKILETGQKSVGDQLAPYQKLEIQVYRPSDQIIQVINEANISGLSTISYKEYKMGDNLRIQAVKSAMNLDKTNYFIEGYVRKHALITLLILFIVVVLVVGRIWGALSLVGLVISFAIIFGLIIPLIIKGVNPVVTAVLGSLVIIPSTFYASHGFNKKTHVGVISTLIALVLVGILAGYFIDATHLTGYASEEAGFLAVERQGSIDIRGILLAGIIIGTLGILDDVTIGQASVIQQLKAANSNLSGWELFKRGMAVGQDHISSMVNTLVLVYSGSALPLLLLFYGGNKGFMDVIEFELIAEEIVRMMVGSIGLVLSAPLATGLAVWLMQDSGKQ